MFYVLLVMQATLTLLCFGVCVVKLQQISELGVYDVSLAMTSWLRLDEHERAELAETMRPSWVRSLATASIESDFESERLDRHHTMGTGIGALRVLSRISLLLGILGAAAVNLGIMRTSSLANLSSSGVEAEALRQTMWVLSLGLSTSVFGIATRWLFVRRLRKERKHYEAFADRLELLTVT